MRRSGKSYLLFRLFYEELKKQGVDENHIIKIPLNDLEYYGKSLKMQLECDFVANQGNCRVYVQAALNISSDEKLKQEENSLLRISDSFKKVIIQKEKNVPHYNDNGIYITCLEDFLMNDQFLLLN